MTDISHLLKTRRWVFWIPDEDQGTEHGFIPHIVIEDHPETYPLVDDHAVAREFLGSTVYVGPTKDDARARCRVINAYRGYDPLTAIEIISSAMLNAAFSKGG